VFTNLTVRYGDNELTVEVYPPDSGQRAREHACSIVLAARAASSAGLKASSIPRTHYRAKRFKSWFCRGLAAL